MTIPGFQSIMLPLLKITSDKSEHNHAEVRDSLAGQFEISEIEKKEMLASGKQARFDNRVAWAIVYLRGAGLIENSSRGIFHITVQGIDLLKTNPDKIDIKLLKQINPGIKKLGKNFDRSIDNENGTISTEKRDELLNLFREFVKSYLLTPEGEKHSDYYEKARVEARKNIESIKLRFNQGEDVTNEILAKLLPYSDTPSNRENCYWISIAPAFSSDPRTKFEAAGWRKDGWNEVADAILSFVRRCDEHPDQLYEACKDFSDSPYSKGFQTGTLTPILNALNPDKFVLINNKSRHVLNYFMNQSYYQSLSEYPRANTTALSLIADVAEDFRSLAKRKSLPVDLFDEFSHWLAAIKGHPLSDAKYWKIAPGDNAWNWEAFREGGFIAIGWEEIGDISMLSRPQFTVKRDDLLKEHTDWNKMGVEQVWKFAHIKEGDRIIANKGTTEVLGIGTVTGPYYFVEGVRHGHRISVEWEDCNPRRINKPGWRKTLIELDKEEFDGIIESHNPIDIYRFFKDREEAEWAYGLLRETLDRLGIKEPNDERFAITCPSGGKALHLNFGQWLVLGFSSADAESKRVDMALLADQANFHNEFESFDFAKGKDEFNIKIYNLPIDLVRPLKGDLRTVYEKSLEQIADKFREWKATPWRKSHIQEIAEALFDDTKLGDPLSPGFQGNVWWVNQGDSIKNERKDGVLCAPARAESSRLIPHWERLIEIKPEDIILHYANGELLYVSMSTASAVTENRPYGRFDKVNLVKVDYYELIPSIPLSRFSEELQALLIKDGPLNVNGGVKEGYLWRLIPEALKVIQRSQPETKWPKFAILDSESSWIFQANPDIFDIDEAIGELTEITWKVNRYKDRVHAGDIVYFWKSGENAGIVAVGKILSEPAHLKDLEIEKRFIRSKAADKNGDKEFIGVRISVERVLRPMVRRQDLLDYPLLRSMQILRQSQGTNFVLNDEESKAIDELINSSNSKPPNPEYTLEQCSRETGLDESTLKRWKKAIERKGQAIIYGPPGTGKTFIAEHLAEHLIGGGHGFRETVQFHPAYTYEDFIQGIRPKNREDGMLEYHLVPGRFLKFCQEAGSRQGTCVLIIDEINRANLARVFGELMYLFEYRGKEIPLASDGNLFSIPENVRIIGTMNTADRSIALVDNALRRRFAFLRLQPEYGILRQYHEREQTEFPIEKLILVLRELNEEIGDTHYEIGISYFIRTDLSTQLEDIWTMEIEPYLEEHFFNNADKIENYRWANVKERLSL